ncbi:MAG TPA: extracellular solute-binding protein [Methylomirabilota bacterium]|nr:extracellular solute-binding protein [Methylomirabilota bacterium]
MSGLGGATRRKFLRSLAAGVGVAVCPNLPFLRTASAADTVILPPGGRLADTIALTYYQDAGWLHAPLWLSPIFRKDAGIAIAGRELYDGNDTMTKVLPQLLAKKPSFDWVQYPAPFFGALAETGQLEPLDGYLAQYPSAKEYLAWVMPAYGEFYAKWNGGIYGIVLDGGIHVLHYRKSRFADARLQKKFSARFQRDLQVPKTWQEFLDCTQFFTEELSDKGIHGASMAVDPPAVAAALWMDIAAGNGVSYFDSNMNPAINMSPAVEALDLYRQIVKFGPGGKQPLDLSQSIQRWQAGADIMSIASMGLAKNLARLQSPQQAEDQGADILPGWKHSDGTIGFRSISMGGRVASIPKNAPPEVKSAAFYFIYRMSHASVSDYLVADPYCGSNPFGASHYTDDEAKRYLEGNPQRETDNPLWPANDGVFSTFATAREYLDGGLKNAQVSYPQLYWDGAADYAASLGHNIARAVAGELTSQQALDQTAEEWTQIVQRRGLDSQKAQYRNVLDGIRKLGYKI